jgi:hypothetical protein
LRRTTASVEKVGAAFGAAGLLVAERNTLCFDDEDDDDEEDDEEDEGDDCGLGACDTGGG